MTLTAFVLAVMASVGVIIILFSLRGRGQVDVVQERLASIGSTAPKNLEQIELSQPFMERTIRPFVTGLSASLTRASSTTMSERMSRRLSLAGNPGNLAAGDWLGVKAIAAFIGMAALLGVAALIGQGLVVIIGAGAAGTLLGYVVPDFWLGRRVKARQKRILRAVPDALDLLTISVRAGLGFDGALAKVVERMPGPLSDEFRRALAEIRVGKTRRDALRDIVTRTEVPALSNFISAIVQAEQLGVAISRVLQVQSEQLRVERRQRAEEAAAKAPIKMLFPLVGCIFPSLFIVILGPALILIMTSLKTH
jgi:tight adherence protein C